jgi:hypothetical protein
MEPTMCKDHSKTLQELKANLEAGGEIPLSFDGADITQDQGDAMEIARLQEAGEKVAAKIKVQDLSFNDIMDAWPEPSLTHEGFEWGYVHAKDLAPLKAALAILERRSHIGPWDIVKQGLQEIIAMNDPEEGHGFGVWPVE